jgi:hypothetical protein
MLRISFELKNQAGSLESTSKNMGSSEIESTFSLVFSTPAIYKLSDSMLRIHAAVRLWGEQRDAARRRATEGTYTVLLNLPSHKVWVRIAVCSHPELCLEGVSPTVGGRVSNFASGGEAFPGDPLLPVNSTQLDQQLSFAK